MTHAQARFAPHRTSFNPDALFGAFDRMISRMDGSTGYPPYNLFRIDDVTHRIDLAVAGFTEDQLTVELEDRDLRVSAEAQPEKDVAAVLHKGIASRAFRHTFKLAEHMKIADAKLANGILSITVVLEVPESAKPRPIKIRTGVDA